MGKVMQLIFGALHPGNPHALTPVTFAVRPGRLPTEDTENDRKLDHRLVGD